MKLTLKDLENKSSWEGYSLFNYDHKAVVENTKNRPEWIHFGAGNIFRIFPANLCQKLLNKGKMDTGIIVGEGFDFEIIDKIYAPHDNLTLGVTLKADGSISKEVIGSVAFAVKCEPDNKADFSILKEAFINPSLKMVSFTITEKGYALTSSDGKIFPSYATDFSHPVKEAKMFLCRLTGLLLERFNNGAFPIALVSMDNCSHNGEKLQKAIIGIAEAWCQNGFVSQNFIDYLKNEKKVSFPWSMIDKITPRPNQLVSDMLKKDGFEDTELVITDKHTYIAPFVNAEEAQYLVIEDSFPNGRPALEEAGVYMTDRDTVNKVEKMKVCTCLNPLHTALAISGCLLGYKLIADEMKDDDLCKMVNILGYKEGLPVVVNPEILDPKSFIDEVIGKRLPNPFMPDTPQRIATDTSQKLSIRFGETIKAYLSDKNLDIEKLEVIPLVYALWCRYLIGIDDNGLPFELSPDPLLEELKALLAGISLGNKNYEDKLKSLLSNEKIFGINVTSSPIYSKVMNYFEKMISSKGMVRKTIHELVNR